MNNVEAIRKLNERELELGIAGTPASWHDRYAHSSVVYVGGLPEGVTEGDVVSVFEQLGTVTHINMVRDEASKKPRGFCFLEFRDQRSTVLAVDNFNGAELYERILRVDHVDKYKPPDPNEVDLVDLNDGLHPAKDITVARPGGGQKGEDQQTAALTEAARRQRVMDRLVAMRARRGMEEEGAGDAPGASRRRSGCVAEAKDVAQTPPAVIEAEGEEARKARKEKRVQKEARREERRLAREERDLRRAERAERKRARR